MTQPDATRPPLYPLFRDLLGRRCVVVGGGRIAARKAADLVRCGAEVRVVSPAFDKAFEALTDIERIASTYRPEHLEAAVVVIASTDDTEVNRQVVADARRLGAWVNAVDQPELCDFHVPAVVARDPIQIAVSTGGASPALARLIRQALEQTLDAAYGQLASLIGELRPRILAEIPDPDARRELLLDFASEPWLARLRSDGLQATRAAMLAAIQARKR